nr:PfkB family carbohydrate kinase [Breoghania sp. L-A4]
MVTHGAKGAEAFGPAGHVRVPGRAVDVVDTVGAGDSFQAALVAGLAERGISSRARLNALTQEDAASIVTVAIHASSLTCSRRGADLPRLDELSDSATETL